MRRFIAAIAGLAFILCFQPMTAKTFADSRIIEAEKNSRIKTVFNMRIEEIEAQANDLLGLSGEAKIDIHIENISPLYDFAGNEYTLIECAPTGYMIYHNKSGNFVESSAVAVSPYNGCIGEKYYGGPNEYYERKQIDGNDIYSFTKGDKILSDTEVDRYSYTSDLVCRALTDEKKETVINYIENNKPMNTAIAKSNNYGNFTCVNNYNFFIKLKDCGDTTIDGNGICGYIAAGMLLTYEQITNGGGVVPSHYYSGNTSSGYSISDTFPKKLYDIGKSLGYGTNTTSVAIHYTVEKYLSYREIEANHTSLYVPIGNNAVITSKIKNNRPVIWFGNITSNSFDDRRNLTHAVVIYGYDVKPIGGYNYVAHFGWTGANIVTFNGILGSIYTFSVD